MIKLTIAQVNHRGEVERHRFDLPYTGQTLREILQHLDPALRPYVTKVTTESFSEPPSDATWDYVPHPNETVLFWCQPAHAALGILTIVGAVLSIGSAIYSLVTRPSTPKTSSASPGMDLWEGITSYAEPGTPIPVVYGELRTGGQIISAYTEIIDDQEYLYLLLCLGHGPVAGILAESALDDRRVDYNYEGTDIDEKVWGGEWDEVDPDTTDDPPIIWINDQLASSYADVYVYFRPGTQGQSVVPGFEKIKTTYSVEQEITAWTSEASAELAQYDRQVEFLNDHKPTSESNCNWLFTGAEYTTSQEVDSITIEICAEQGFYNAHSKEGYKDQEVGLIISWYSYSSDDPSTHIESDTIERTEDTCLKGKWGGPHSWSFTINLSQKAKIHFEAKVVSVGHWEDWDQWRLWVRNVTETINETRTYDGYALLGLKMKASGQLSGSIPNVTCLLRGKSDIEYWDGSQWTTGWTRNPIWCVRDLLLNETYGCGPWVSKESVSGWVEQAWKDEAAYCDQMITVSDSETGEEYDEPRFSLDIVINNRQKAGDALETLLQTCRGSIVRAGTKRKPVIDRPRDRTQIFTNANVLKGTFHVQQHGLSNTYNTISATFQDKDLDYETNSFDWCTEAVQNGEEPIRSTSMSLPGVVRWSQVQRLVTYYLNKMQALRRTASWEAAVDSIACEPGDRVGVQDEMFLPPPKGGTGRIQSADGTTLTVDKYIELNEDTSYKIIVRDSDTDTWEERTVTGWSMTEGEPPYTITVSSAFSFTPAFPDIYVIGESGYVVKDFIITEITRTAELTCRIEAIEYNEDVYDGTDVADTKPFAASSVTDLFNVGSISGLVISYEYVNAMGKGVVNVHAGWDITGSKAAYGGAIIYWQEEGYDNWNVLSYVYGNYDWVYEDAPQGIKGTLKVVPFSKSGDANPAGAATASVYVEPYNPVPSDVTAVSWTIQSDGSVHISWSDISDVDLAGYEIRTEDANWGDASSALYRGRLTEYTLQPEDQPARTCTLYLKAYDDQGAYSENAYQINIDNPLPEASNLTATAHFQTISLTWDETTDPDFAYWVVYGSQTSGFTPSDENALAIVRGTSYAFLGGPGETWYFRVAGVDKLGQRHLGDNSMSTEVSATITYIEQGDLDPGPPATPTGLTATSGTTSDVDGTIRCWAQVSWNANTESDLSHYDLEAERWDGAQWLFALSATAHSNQYISYAIANTSYRVRVRAVDFAGNTSDWTSWHEFTTVKDEQAPSASTSLSATALPGGVLLEWDVPDLGNPPWDYAHTEIWRATTNDRDQASELATIRSTHFVDRNVNLGTTYYYWVRHVDTSGNISDWYPAGATEGVSLTTRGVQTGDVDSVSADKIAETASKKWAAEHGADITSNHTAHNTSNVSSIPASHVAGWAHSSDTTKIDGGQIYTGTVTASKINVNQLSAISADMGTLTAGLIQAVSGNAKIVVDADNKRIEVYDENGTLRVRLGQL